MATSDFKNESSPRWQQSNCHIRGFKTAIHKVTCDVYIPFYLHLKCMLKHCPVYLTNVFKWCQKTFGRECCGCFFVSGTGMKNPVIHHLLISVNSLLLSFCLSLVSVAHCSNPTSPSPCLYVSDKLPQHMLHLLFFFQQILQ